MSESQPIAAHETQAERKPRFPLLHSIIRIMRDPDETSHGARMVLTFDRKQAEKSYQEFLADDEGRRILDGAPSLFELLTNRDSLRQLPEGSVGRIYLDYMIREGISTEGLDAEVAPVEQEVLQSEAARQRFSQHMRASHDLWHVLTGYHRDLLGEMQLLAFSYFQTGSPSFKWLTRLARIGAGRQIPEAKGLLDLAEKRGRESRWLATADWATLLRQPIEEVRSILGIGAPPTYTRYMRNPDGRGLVPEPIAH
jgi:ubiquinone biosynthesis protein COQ4